MESHQHHDHAHKDGCGHTKVKHGDHIDFLHDGHLHNMHNGEVEEHVIEFSSQNPNICLRMECSDSTRHADAAESVPHGDHVDYLVNGRLHHVHDDHCDDHGPLLVA